MTDLPYWTLHEAPPDSPKKWAVRVPTSSGRGKVVLFGARGYEDFTTHHDVERRERYRTRHQRDRLDDPYAPGFWSMWALWGESDDLDTAFAAAVRKAKKLMEKPMPRTPRKNPVHEQFSFSHYEEYANRLTDDQLHHAIIDALDALKVARTWEDNGAGEAKYLDQLSVLRREQKARGMRSNPDEDPSGKLFGPVGRDLDNWTPEKVRAFSRQAEQLSDSQLERKIADEKEWMTEYPWMATDLENRLFLYNYEKKRRSRQNPALREDWLEKAREAGRVDAVNFRSTIAERRDYLAQTGWRSLDEDDRMALLRAWEQGVSEVRKNPEWARKVGGAMYRGTRKAAKYAKEVGTDLYHGAREAHRTHRSNPRLSTCAQQYLETALWSSTDEDGAPLDDQFDVSDFAPEAIRQAEKDCLDFLSTNDVGDLDEGDVGHNFWLTRNHHGAGFWDRGLGALGDRLTKAAHAYGECDIYLGDDGKLHLS